MPTGTSDGQYYESDLHQLFNMPVEAPSSPAGASKSKTGTGVANENKRTSEAPSSSHEVPITKISAEKKDDRNTKDNPLYEFTDEGKKYHFRYTPDEFQKQFGKDPIHNDWDEMFRFKNGDYGIHIAPPVPQGDDPTPIGIKGDYEGKPRSIEDLVSKTNEAELRDLIEQLHMKDPKFYQKYGPPSENLENRLLKPPEEPTLEGELRRIDNGNKYRERGEFLLKHPSDDIMAIQAGINKIASPNKAKKKK